MTRPESKPTGTHPTVPQAAPHTARHSTSNATAPSVPRRRRTGSRPRLGDNQTHLEHEASRGDLGQPPGADASRLQNLHARPAPEPRWDLDVEQLEDPDPDQDQDFDPDSDPFTELGVESDPHGVGTFGADLRMGDPLLRSPLTVDQSPLYRARTLRDRRREREAPADRPRANTAIRRVLRERLTDRDVWILRMLTEHRVLTTHQIADLAFSNEHTARRRMLALLSLGVVDRFRPYVAVGSVPLHYVLSAWGGDFLRHLDRDPAAVRHWRPANRV